MHFAFLFYAPDPILWQWGFLSIRWYGVIMAIAVFLAIKLSQFLAKYKGIDKKLMAYLASWLMVGSLIFSRLFYLLFYHKTAINWWAIKGGGLSIYGALLGSFIVTWLFARYNQIQLGKIIDILVPSLALGQAIGLWGHFFNNEAYGFPTNVVWRLYIPITQRERVTFVKTDILKSSTVGWAKPEKPLKLMRKLSALPTLPIIVLMN